MNQRALKPHKMRTFVDMALNETLAEISDPETRFRVARGFATPNPQQAVWWGMHQDYSENFIADEIAPAEEKAGEICVKRLLLGDRGHYGPLEHPQITFGVGNFPHDVMQQARTHRVGTSFDVQSGRYTGQRIIDVSIGKREVEDVFFFRPVGRYADREGGKYEYTKVNQISDIGYCYEAACRYAAAVKAGRSEEHARQQIPYGIRQHYVVSFNLRSALHFMDLRAKKDAQWEIQQLCELMWPLLKAWAPEICSWYQQSRLHKARLSP